MGRANFDQTYHLVARKNSVGSANFDQAYHSIARV